jgi:predicted alpha/beta superfamily hydrolase
MVKRIEKFVWKRREVTVLLPKGYAKNLSRKYPAVITQDGDYLFKHLAWRHRSDIIFIGLTPINRNTEYVPWNAETDVGSYIGSADDYLQMLTQEFIPFMLEHYRIDSEDLGISGGSFGGLVSLYALLKYTSHFKRFILLFPSLWYPDFLKYIEERPKIQEAKFVFWYVGGAEAVGRNNIMGSMVPNNKKAVQLMTELLSHPDSKFIFMTNDHGLHRHRFFKDHFRQAIDLLYKK